MPNVALPQAEFKVVMLGDTNVGKTSLVLRFAEGYYREEGRSATVGAFFITKRLQTTNGITCKVQIWDTAGQAQFRKMAPMYYQNAAAAIVCYDVSNPKSFTVLKEWLDELHEKVTGEMALAIAATKSDLADEPSTREIVPASHAKELATKVGAIFIDTSARNNSNVNLLFQRISERVLFLREQAKFNGSHEENSVTVGASVNDESKIVRSWRGSPTAEGSNYSTTSRIHTDFHEGDDNEIKKGQHREAAAQDLSIDDEYSSFCAGPWGCASSQNDDEAGNCILS